MRRHRPDELRRRIGVVAAALVLSVFAPVLSIVGCSEPIEGAVEPDAPPPSPGVAWLEGSEVDLPMLASWVRSGGYRAWERSPGVFPSIAGGGSRIYLNAVLQASLADGSRVHPAGSIGVREVYFDDLLTLRGVNVTVKVEDGEAEASRWLFVELYDLAPGGQPTIAERGAPACLRCHRATRDFVRSEWPLR